MTVPLSQNQYDALVSYVFNTGSLYGTQLLQKLNAGDFAGAVEEMDINTSGGQYVQGLEDRGKEKEICLKMEFMKNVISTNLIKTIQMNRLLIIIVLLYSLSGCQIQKNNSDLSKVKSEIYGKWIVKEVLEKQSNKYTSEQIDQIKKSTLIVETNKIYLKNINFIDSCSFVKSNIKTSHLLDPKNFEYSWYKEGNTLLILPKMAGPIIYKYSKEELSKMILIDLGCGYDLSILYLNGDELIVNYLNGISLILKKK